MNKTLTKRSFSIKKKDEVGESFMLSDTSDKKMSTTEYKLQAVWSIKKETFLNTEGYLQSAEFQTTLPNVHYYITVCPDDASNNGYTSISFIISQSVTIKEMNLYVSSANFQYDFSIKDSFSDELFQDCNTVYIKRDEILAPENEFFVDDILTVEINGILCFEEVPYFDLGRVLWAKEDKDFTFVVGNESIKAHKFILRQFSSILASEADSDKLEIENFDKSIVIAAVELCYGLRRSFFFLDRPNVDEITSLLKLIEFTNVYDMPLIKEQVEHKLKELITAQNVCELANESLDLKAEILGSFCVNFLSNCIKTGKAFNGNLSSLKIEIVASVFKNSFSHTQIS